MTQNVHDVQLENGYSGSGDADWSLTADQMIFMLEHHNAIEAADTADDDAFFEQFINAAEFRTLFGDMTFDEAYDRYETALLPL